MSTLQWIGIINLLKLCRLSPFWVRERQESFKGHRQHNLSGKRALQWASTFSVCGQKVMSFVFTPLGQVAVSMFFETRKSLSPKYSCGLDNSKKQWRCQTHVPTSKNRMIHFKGMRDIWWKACQSPNPRNPIFNIGEGRCQTHVPISKRRMSHCDELQGFWRKRCQTLNLRNPTFIIFRSSGNGSVK